MLAFWLCVCYAVVFVVAATAANLAAVRESRLARERLQGRR